MRYYLELDKNKKVVSWGYTIGNYPKTQKIDNIMLSISEYEYKMYDACAGDLETGINVLKNIREILS